EGPAHGAPCPRRRAWGGPRARLVSEGVLGELLTRTLPSTGAGDDAPAAARSVPPLSEDEVQRAAAGWGGDAYRVWDVGGRTLLVWRSEWDRTDDAREFQDAFLRRLERTHGPRRAMQGFAVFTRAGWSMAVAGAAGSVTLVPSDDPGPPSAAPKATG